MKLSVWRYQRVTSELSFGAHFERGAHENEIYRLGAKQTAVTDDVERFDYAEARLLLGATIQCLGTAWAFRPSIRLALSSRKGQLRSTC